MMFKKKIGLALGGGGARGLAHIGLLRVLGDRKIDIDSIAGTSMGAIVGACYAVNPDIDAVEKQIRDVVCSPLFSKLKINFFQKHGDEPSSEKGFFARTKSIIIDGVISILGEAKYSFLPEDKLGQFINILLPDIDIRKTKIKFACVATDLTNGREKIFFEGSLRKCVLASSSIPAVFPPVKIEGIYYNDGGAVNVTPVKVAQLLGADYIVACDVKSRIMRWEKPEKANEILNRSNYITGSILNEINLKYADIVISPEVKHVHWTGFDKIDFLIEKGREAAFLKVDEISGVQDNTLWNRTIKMLKKMYFKKVGKLT